MRYTVVIPARNSRRTIESTLLAVLNGDRRPDEILVVDGCSIDDTAAVAARLGVRVVNNPQKHVAAARQLGTTEANAEVIAFTDSDCIPEPGWLSKIAGHFEADPNLAGVGGRVVLSQPRNKTQAYSAHVFEAIMQFPDETMLITTRAMRGTFAGANCSYRRDSILAVGGFREFFSNHAEEVDLFWRLIATRAKLLFDPGIVVEHLEYADSLKRLVKANFNYGIASTKLAKMHIGRQINLGMYRLALASLLCSVNPFCTDKWARLRLLQTSTFIVGKLYASAKFRTINL